jgi:hypothetical protein
MRLNLATAEVEFRGNRISLTRREFALLQVLMERAGRIVRRESAGKLRLWAGYRGGTQCDRGAGALAAPQAESRGDPPRYAAHGGYMIAQREPDE